MKEGFLILLEEYLQLAEKYYQGEGRQGNIDMRVLAESKERMNRLVDDAETDEEYAAAICEMLELFDSAGAQDGQHMTYENMMELISSVKKHKGRSRERSI